MVIEKVRTPLTKVASFEGLRITVAARAIAPPNGLAA